MAHLSTTFSIPYSPREHHRYRDGSRPGAAEGIEHFESGVGRRQGGGARLPDRDDLPTTGHGIFDRSLDRLSRVRTSSRRRPLIVAVLMMGTISSPWLPRVIASTSAGVDRRRPRQRRPEASRVERSLPFRSPVLGENRSCEALLWSSRQAG